MTEAAKERRRQLDHERYMSQREERLKRRRAYYAANREACIASIRRSEQRRIRLLKIELWKT